MPLLLPVTVGSLVSVVEVHTDSHLFSLKLSRDLNRFNHTLSEVLILCELFSVALPMDSHQLDTVCKVELIFLLFNYTDVKVKRQKAAGLIHLVKEKLEVFGFLRNMNLLNNGPSI